VEQLPPPGLYFSLAVCFFLPRSEQIAGPPYPHLLFQLGSPMDRVGRVISGQFLGAVLAAN